MRLELRHLRHPLRTANTAKSVVAERFDSRRFAARGERFFANDPRYDLQRVTEGFADRFDSEGDDVARAQTSASSASNGKHC